MSPHALHWNATLLAAAWAGGILFGWCYFEALRRSVALYGSREGRAGSLTLTAGRMLAAAAFFAIAARLGALPLLVALLGFLVARGMAVRSARMVRSARAAAAAAAAARRMP